ncbi:hypothetical protein JTB14_037160 [Gonioctena quinquepunctata]|nr:hypothetical protein JTB14_037160 [Gonioctena quinquepunctata]
MVILLMILSQLFLFLWFANDIKVESSAIPNIIYTDTNWLSYNVRTRKILIMMMTRSQKPMTCYSAAIGEMTIETFKNQNTILGTKRDKSGATSLFEYVLTIWKFKMDVPKWFIECEIQLDM